MDPYVRPPIARPAYADENGELVDYGNRWAGREVPEDAYSRTSHLERFQPLHPTADALISWLLERYDASSFEYPSSAQDDRTVRITPADPSAAPLTFVFTDFPGVIIQAGTLFEAIFPRCGCDACDEDIDEVVDDLEWTVRALVGGSFSEQVDAPSPQWVSTSLAWDDRSMSGGTIRDDLTDEALAAARRRLPSPSGVWSAWPLRTPA
ncbi:DUF6226 family protein [Leifsonia sp. F6_8S_P_1B]|uniref:DUF6226 family protein n=1 Tax=Leifsonia williamsii TaxID=3035919 RepID=A0ABT8KHZ1_9MICO|nr:DUF6226 family protein [Leifsonia williamsii]MDN4616067.1 DUF6226 family protein [Leifsonia williamsii]